VKKKAESGKCVLFIVGIWYPEWDPAYKPSVTCLPIPFNSWVDDPPELNEYMLPALQKNGNESGRAGEPKTRWDHILVE
jgi:hypothetical protein